MVGYKKRDYHIMIKKAETTLSYIVIIVAIALLATLIGINPALLCAWTIVPLMQLDLENYLNNTQSYINRIATSCTNFLNRFTSLLWDSKEPISNTDAATKIIKFSLYIIIAANAFFPTIFVPLAMALLLYDNFMPISSLKSTLFPYEKDINGFIDDTKRATHDIMTRITDTLVGAVSTDHLSKHSNIDAYHSGGYRINAR